MNILIPHNWLLDHLETNANPLEIQKYVSLSGPSIERIYDIEGDSIYDIEVTTNRVDSMSVRGIAREAAVILTQAGFPSSLKPEIKIPAFITHPKKSEHPSLPMPHIINDETLCARILCVVLTQVTSISSPDWMQQRLRQVGLHTHDAIIDITNYVTHDLGHPCHAFDYDKIMKLGGTIRVVKATPGKHFVTLDGVQYETVGGEVVFENSEGEIIDIPGIKGTMNTAVSSDTKNVLFWIESISPSLIRFTSMTHAIRTVAAQLNEKGIDPHMALPVFASGIQFFETVAHAHIEKETFIDLYKSEKTMNTIDMPLDRIYQYLGIIIETPRIKSILESLGCHVKIVGDAIRVTPPSYRPDITIPEDIVEEIARIFGYHNLPSVLMTGSIPTLRPEDTNFAMEHEMKIRLATLGGYEVYTYSLISETLAQLEGNVPAHIRLKNPLTDDMVYLRHTLWASHAPILRSQSPAFVFELANVYTKSDPDEGSTLPREDLRLTLTSTQGAGKIKGVLDALIHSLYLPPVSYHSHDGKVRIQASDIVLGELHTFVLGDKTYTCIDLQWKTLVLTARKYPIVTSIPKVAPIIEDMTFTRTKPTFVQDMTLAIKQCDPLIHAVVYKNAYKQNVTFTIYYQPQTEMNANELAPIRKQIIDMMRTRYAATLVGKPNSSEK